MPTANTLQPGQIDAFLKDPRFTQTFDCPAHIAQGPERDALRVSYADYGYRNEENPESENVFLFCSPLAGSRLLHVAKDAVAKEHKVRIINADRPGFGKTPDVEPEKRLAQWREVILALLQHLKIRHVSLGAQSGGTVYALDLILHHPEILHPELGYLALGGPWVHPSHSGIWHMSMAEALPASVLAHTDKVASYFNMISAPVIGKGLSLVGSAKEWLSPHPPQRDAASTDEAGAFAEAVDAKLGGFIFANSVAGISNEAILLLQRPNVQGASGWADWGDYDALVPRLRQALAENNRRLVVDTFLGEADFMIGSPGTAGPDWFIDCWKSTGEHDPIEFSHRVVPGANHDSIWATKWGVARDVFTRIETFGSSNVQNA